MIITTQGIVLRAVPFSDSGIILTVYTLAEGRASVMIRVSKSNRTNRALKEALTIADFTYSRRKDNDLVYLKDANIIYPYTGLATQFDKRAIATFINEVLLKSIQEEESNPGLYNFIRDGLIKLDQADEYADFHIWFMIKLTALLGFPPQYKGEKYLDLRLGEGIDYEPDHSSILEATNAKFLMNVLSAEDHTLFPIRNRDKRNYLLNGLIQYFKIQLDDFRDLKSIEVLQAVYGDIRD